MTVQNLEYYRLRADEEALAAEQAVDPAIAQIHRDMAQRYGELIADAGVPAEHLANRGLREVSAHA